MEFRTQIQLTGEALRRWFVAECLDSACVGLLWLAGLMVLRIPWAPFWALLAAGFHFIPHIGGLLALLGPLFAGVVADFGWEGVLRLVVLYAIVMLSDALVLQPTIMRRTAKVPVWASIAVPLVMGYFFSFWGILLSAPALVIFYTFRAHQRELRELPPTIEIIPPAIASQRRPETPPAVIES